MLHHGTEGEQNQLEQKESMGKSIAVGTEGEPAGMLKGTRPWQVGEIWYCSSNYE